MGRLTKSILSILLQSSRTVVVDFFSFTLFCLCSMSLKGVDWRRRRRGERKTDCQIHGRILSLSLSSAIVHVTLSLLLLLLTRSVAMWCEGGGGGGGRGGGHGQDFSSLFLPREANFPGSSLISSPSLFGPRLLLLLSFVTEFSCQHPSFTQAFKGTTRKGRRAVGAHNFSSPGPNGIQLYVVTLHTAC